MRWLLRRHRTDRPSRLDRHVGRLAAIALRQGRAGRIGADYINCPLDPRSVRGVRGRAGGRRQGGLPRLGKTTPYFDGCLPIEVMAERGRETLRHGPMKPFGLTNPHAPQVKPYAVVQLRQDNRLGTLFNMVGFQTKLNTASRCGSSALFPGSNRPNSRASAGCTATPFSTPKLLDETLRLKALPRLRFAGQSPAAKAMWNRPRSGSLPADSPPPNDSGEPKVRHRHHGARSAARPHHWRTYRDHRCRAALLSADECQFRPFSPACGDADQGRSRPTVARPSQNDRKEARLDGTGADRSGWLDPRRMSDRCRIALT